MTVTTKTTRTNDYFLIVATDRPAVLQANARTGYVDLVPPARPSPKKQLWRREGNGFVSAEGLNLVERDDWCASTKDGSGTPLVLDGDTLRVGKKGKKLAAREGYDALYFDDTESCAWKLAPALASKPDPSNDPRSETIRALFSKATAGDAKARKEFSKQLLGLDQKKLRIGVGPIGATVQMWTSRIWPRTAIELVEPFQAPLFWSPSIARLYACDCAERVVEVFDRSSYGDGQGQRAIDTARAYARGEADETDLEKALKATKAVEPWDSVRYALESCAACVASNAELDIGHIVRKVLEVRQFEPASLAAGLKSKAAIKQEEAWQTERIWMYLSGQMDAPVGPPASKHQVAAQSLLKRTEAAKQELLALEKPLQKALKAAEAAKDKAAVQTLRKALKLLQ